MKYWETLLIEQRRIGKDGLTIPFLIGSQSYLPSTNSKQSIEELIHDILNRNNIKICLKYCMSVSTLILEIKKYENGFYYPNYNNKNQNILAISLILKQSLGDNINSLIGHLINQFEHIIKNEQYSAKSGIYERSAEWSDFSNTEIDFIENCFKRSHENTILSNKL